MSWHERAFASAASDGSWGSVWRQGTPRPCSVRMRIQALSCELILIGILISGSLSREPRSVNRPGRSFVVPSFKPECLCVRPRFETGMHPSKRRYVVSTGPAAGINDKCGCVLHAARVARCAPFAGQCLQAKRRRGLVRTSLTQQAVAANSINGCIENHHDAAIWYPSPGFHPASFSLSQKINDARLQLPNCLNEFLPAFFTLATCVAALQGHVACRTCGGHGLGHSRTVWS